jgi:HD superfamily phosphohydrolase
MRKIFNIRNKYELLRKAKDIHLPVHGSVSVTLMAQYFIDNKYFQRLNDLKQLGTCDFIFPGAKHTRFEHSIGTYYLADRIMMRIKSTSDNCKMSVWLGKIPELKTHYENVENQQGLNNWVIELVKIAALCHDVGHGPYSHIFDDVFVKNSIYKDHPLASHEARSCEIVEKIVQESEILSAHVTPDDIKFIQSLIDPPKDCIGFIYQIVSNNLNGLDVDKYDYINRDSLHTGIKNGFDHSRLVDSVQVIDDRIVYPEQSDQNIYNLFMTRYALHRQIYCHKGVISAQYMIIDIMSILDKVINISESILDLNNFVDMTDSYIIQSMKNVLRLEKNISNPYKDILTEKDYDNLRILQTRILTHNLYSHIATFITKSPIDENLLREFSDNEITSGYVISKNKIGFVSGNKQNPLDSIYVYKTKDMFVNGFNVKAQLINKHDITYIIPEIYQEYVTMIFRKDRDPDGIINDKSKCQSIMTNIKLSE